jgi:hypothetical protein
VFTSFGPGSRVSLRSPGTRKTSDQEDQKMRQPETEWLRSR